MAKYKLKSLNVQIEGTVYFKENGDIFDTDGVFSTQKAIIEVAFKAGYLELIEDEPKVESKVNKK